MAVELLRDPVARLAEQRVVRLAAPEPCHAVDQEAVHAVAGPERKPARRAAQALHQLEHLEVVPDEAVRHERDHAQAVRIGRRRAGALHRVRHHGAAVGLEGVDVGACLAPGLGGGDLWHRKELAARAAEVDHLEGVVGMQVVEHPAHRLLRLLERGAHLRSGAVDDEEHLLRRRRLGRDALRR